MGATSEGTKKYFEKHALPVPSIEFGRTSWSVSPIGFGTYRIDETHEAHAKALKLALLKGCNLIDTSTNYMDGSSERAVGKVIAQLIDLGEITRQNIVIVTKAGYVQGENMNLVRDAQNKKPFGDVVEYSEQCWH